MLDRVAIRNLITCLVGDCLKASILNVGISWLVDLTIKYFVFVIIDVKRTIELADTILTDDWVEFTLYELVSLFLHFAQSEQLLIELLSVIPIDRLLEVGPSADVPEQGVMFVARHVLIIVQGVGKVVFEAQGVRRRCLNVLNLLVVL